MSIKKGFVEMSFSSEQKEIIISQHYKASCCRRAILSGILFSKGNILGDNTVIIHTERMIYAEFIAKLIREYYTKNIEITRDKTGGRYLSLIFKSQSAADYIINISSDNLFFAKCDACMQSFLRGVFFASGRFTDPNKQFMLEFSLGERSIYFADFLSEYGIIPLISYKKSEAVAYFKSSAMIENFSAAAGLNKAFFAILNSKAKSDMRQDASRKRNCETNNIAKSVDAATKYITVIKRLEETNLMSSLPDDLEATARLRLENAELSLAQLAAISNPPISKPGIAHRLKKILEIGTQLLEEKERNL